MKTIGKCSYCGDPIYDFQEITHSGCNVKQVLSKDEDGIWCPRCGEVFHDEDMNKHPEDYYTCPTCFTIEHEKCRHLSARIWNEDGTSGVATGANKPATMEEIKTNPELYPITQPNKKEVIQMASSLAREKAAQAWCQPTTEKLGMIPELAEAFAEILDEVWSKPWLGNATNLQLIEELHIRHQLGHTAPNYKSIN